MTFRDFLRKITSRKFIISLISVLSGVGMMFTQNSSVFAIAASVILIGIPSVVYCVVEGRLDDKSLKNILNTIHEAYNAITDRDEGENDDNDGDYNSGG